MEQDQKQPRQVQGLSCPLPHTHTETVVIGHGSGGSMTQDLIRSIFQSQIGNEILAEGNDAARLQLFSHGEQLAVSTDSHVVSPLFFPGGDIGRLAVSGTVNDVAMLGAHPAFLTAGFILEEGFPMADLNRIIKSIADTCREAGVQIIAGDTKVVEKGKADGIYINTAGLGLIPEGRKIGGQFAKPGDAVLISGTLGEHSIAVLEARGELGFESGIQSDVAPLNHMLEDLLAAVPDVHVLRDPTRGGLATSLNEIACQSQVSIHLTEGAIPVQPNVRIACEMLGFDPLYLANEGKVIIILPEEHVELALNIVRASPYGKYAARIGRISEENPGRVLLHTAFGTTRLLSMLAGEILPRIC
ncbi:MAG: hydrogenase expression/formation protein HypE [Brevefilum sp.]|nr:hydrogenase expression/formation protein HypE [Brevefilum sp.]